LNGSVPITPKEPRPVLKPFFAAVNGGHFCGGKPHQSETCISPEGGSSPGGHQTCHLLLPVSSRTLRGGGTWPHRW
uniref:Uncharacterized protein n=1 Tax=Naja naja TaxID=35670 RepID=A0A8C7DXC9_NAJNA